MEPPTLKALNIQALNIMSTVPPLSSVIRTRKVGIILDIAAPRNPILIDKP